MPVDSKHLDYQKHYPQWKKCRDAIEGEEAVKGAGVAYLPRLSDQDDLDYNSYRLRASFYGASGRTVKGLTGTVMRKPPQVDFPESAKEDLLKRVGEGGEDFVQLTSQVLEETLGVSRVGVMVDAPEGDNGDPYVTIYYAENIINWREEMITGDDGKSRLQPVMVVICEEVQLPDEKDEFDVVAEERYRVLRLTEGDVGERVYSVELWHKVKVKDGTGAAEKTVDRWEQIGETVYPAFRGGKRPDFIPFKFINPTGTTAEVEKSPLIDLVNVNLAHYRNSADLEHGRHFTGLPTLYLAGFDPDKTKVKIGSSAAWTSENPQAKAEYVEFKGQGLSELRLALDEKQKLMAVLGARLLEEQNANETATAVRLRQSGEKSVLATVAATVSEAMTDVLRWVAMWSGTAGGEKGAIALSQDYDVAHLDAQTLTALMATLQGGSYSFESWFNYMQKAGMYPDDWTIEDERQAIEAGTPMSPAGSITQQKDELSLKQQKELLKKQKEGGPIPAVPPPGAPPAVPPKPAPAPKEEAA